MTYANKQNLHNKLQEEKQQLRYASIGQKQNYSKLRRKKHF